MASISKENLQELKKLGLTFESEWNKTEVQLSEEAKRLQIIVEQNKEIIALLKQLNSSFVLRTFERGKCELN